MIPDYAKGVKAAVAADWSTAHPLWSAVLEVPDKFDPAAGRRVLLVADDGGPALLRGAWLVTATPRLTTLRLTAYADGRTAALETVGAAAEFVLVNRPGIARIEDVSVPLVTRKPDTGATLASITMPVIVRQTA